MSDPVTEAFTAYECAQSMPLKDYATGTVKLISPYGSEFERRRAERSFRAGFEAGHREGAPQ